MKIQNLVFSTLFMLTGCVVCPKIFLPSNANRKADTSFKTNGMILSCDVPVACEKCLTVLLRFEPNTKIDTVKDITIDLRLENGRPIELKSVSMSCWQEKINPLNDRNFSKKRFSELPLTFRLTSINGSEVQYSFEYSTPSPIKSKSIELRYAVKLFSGNDLQEKLKLDMTRTCHLAIH